MDTSGFSQVGRYGTLSLLKRHPPQIPSAPAPTDTNNVITSFGIDDEELTFGSSTACGVRLYYDDVDALHCRIVFEERKAFLAVLGVSGVLVDGCKVYPHTSASSTTADGARQTIIPLTNNSEFEIHSKRFRFTYPPKEVRKALFATPARPPKRALRLSMIHSAQVFSPRPSKDPRENLRILQSPLKNNFGTGRSPAKRSTSPLKLTSRASESDDEEDEEEIVLVQTNHPRVVEEEKDLVILEDVPVQLLQASSSPRSSSPTKQQNQLHQPQPQLQQPRTPPRRKSLGGTALHRAVLIRSAQRAVWKAEKEREEEEEKEEEMEVLGAVVAVVDADNDGDDDDDDEYEERDEIEDVEMRDANEDDGEDEEYTDEEDEEEDRKRKESQKPLWRKSLERIIPWPFGVAGSGSEGADEEEHDEQAAHGNDGYERDEHDDNYDEEHDEDENEAPAPLPARPSAQLAPPHTPVRRALGSFMTPQPRHQHQQANREQGDEPRRDIFRAQAQAPIPAAGRYSLGGGGAARIILQQPWRVRDLVVPVPDAFNAAAQVPAPTPARRPMDPPPSSGLFLNPKPMPVPPSTPVRASTTAAASGNDTGAVGSPARVRATPSVSEEERKSIQERRKSALKDVGMVWAGGAPGMSPTKSGASAGSTSTSTISSSSSTLSSTLTSGVSSRRNSASPVKLSSTSAGVSHQRGIFASPTKGRPLAHAIAEEDDGGVDRRKEDEDDEELDTRGLLERMKETVEGMKRRRSVALGAGAGGILSTPQPPAPDMVAASSSRMSLGPGIGAGMGSIKKLDFTRITPAKPPSKGLGATPGVQRQASPNPVLEEQIQDQDNKDEDNSDKAAVEEEEPFSLLRPGARDERRQSVFDAAVTPAEEARPNESESVVPVLLPTVVVDPAEEDEQEEEERPAEREEEKKSKKARGRPRLLRAPKAVIEQAGEEDNDMEHEDEVEKTSKPKSASKTTTKASGVRRQRSRTPQPQEEEQVTPEPKKSTATARRTRKGTAELEETPVVAAPRRGRKAVEHDSGDQESAGQEEKKAPAPVKRGRKLRTPAAVVEEEHEEMEDAAPTPAHAPVKRGRPAKKAPAAAVASPAEESSTQDEGASATKTKSKAKTGAKVKDATTMKKTIPKPRATAKGKAAAAVPVEDEDEEDPLDSYHVTGHDHEMGADVVDEDDENADLPAPPPPRASAAAAAAAAAKPKPTKSRKKAAPVKQEEVEEEGSSAMEEATTRVGRGAKANAAAATTKTPAARKTTATANTTATGKPRGRPKTPATAPAALPTSSIDDDNAEKENTPGPAGSEKDSNNGKLSPGGAGAGADDGAPVKVRVSRTRGAAGAGARKVVGKAKVNVKIEEGDEGQGGSGAPAGRTRVTRVMRTRTRTG